MRKNQGTIELSTNKQDEYCISIYLLVVKGYVEKIVEKVENTEKMTCFGTAMSQ